eukprot:TRINITY_DN21628_c0_g1_i1.p1 TRINITY_DN21628_c0_g1~~TRINITY_DN21628_c0_g1_i1.p1  ORF type:complete len:514 (-),score=83.84 TRINITY_DN21628_c0_g1_i1:108-1595(-)
MRCTGRIPTLALCGVHLASAAYWQVSEGDCKIEGNCLESPHYPANYQALENCRVTIQDGWDTKVINVASFTTEGCCDTLTVNGQSYSGAAGPEGVRPTGDIIWESDPQVHRSGWKLCPRDESTAEVGALDEDGGGSPVVIIIVVVAALVLIAVGGGLFWMSRKKRSSPPETKAEAAYVPGAAAAPPVMMPAVAPPAGVAPPAAVVAVPSEVSKMRTSATEGYEGGPSEIRIEPKRTPVTPKAEDLKPPPYWKNQEAVLADCSMEPGSAEEIEFLQKMLDSSFKFVKTRDRKEDSLPTRLKVVHCQRIENGPVWRKYCEGRTFIQQKRPHKCTSFKQYGGDLETHAELPPSMQSTCRDRQNEIFLWHGTSPHGAAGIAADGFSTKFSGSNVGTMYGSGLYFAECSSKSDEYARDDKDGIYKGLFSMLLCRATLGELLHMTAGGDKTHGMIRSAIESDEYDSVLGDRKASVGTYREFVVYSGDQVYPEYLILYQREW